MNYIDIGQNLIIKMEDKEIIDIKNEELEEKDPWYKGPIRIILTLFLLLLITMWVFSYYAVKINPSPGKIPLVEEVFTQNFEINISSNRDMINKEDYFSLIVPNDPVIKQTADKIVSIACEGSKICHAKAIFYFVRDNFQYVSDPTDFEYVKGARESLVTKTLDCEDGAILLANLMEAVGIDTRFVFIPKHVYIDIWLPEAAKRYKQKDSWISLDVTCKNCDFGEIPFQNINQKKTYS